NSIGPNPDRLDLETQNPETQNPETQNPEITNPIVLILHHSDWGSLLADLILLGQSPENPSFRPLLVGLPPNLRALRQAQALGAWGYCLPTVTPEVLIQLVTQVATGKTWVEDPAAATVGLPLLGTMTEPGSDRSPESGSIGPQVTGPQTPATLQTSLQKRLRPLLRSGLRQVQTTLAHTPDPQRDPMALPWTQPWFNQRLAAGQWRELQAAQWLLQRSLRAMGEDPSIGLEPPGTQAETTDFGTLGPQTNFWNPAGNAAENTSEDRARDVAENGGGNTAAIDRQTQETGPAAPSRSNTGETAQSDRTLGPFYPSNLAPWPLNTPPDPVQFQTFFMARLRDQLQHSPLHNTTEVPLELDILRTDKQRELLLLILACWDHQMTDLRQEWPEADRAGVPFSQRLAHGVQDLWQAVLTQFLQPYGDLSPDLDGAWEWFGGGIAGNEASSEQNWPPVWRSEMGWAGGQGRTENISDRGPMPLGRSSTGNLGRIERRGNQNRADRTESERLNLISELLQALPTVDREILQQIPQLPVLFSALLWGTPVPLDGVPYRLPAPEALDRLLLLGQNFLITIANAVMQPLLDRFGHREVIKQTLYRQQLLSTREVERFRNNLSWKYRVVLYWETPQSIYESCHWLWGFDRQGLRQYRIYAPRRGELDRLTRLQQAYTLVLELRDAIAPRLRALTAWVGSGVVYVLTQVVGRAIGLIGRGILQGIGASWTDRR
ncbi:MAG: DUF3685 domain-containing protein, partial [Prochlorothrix sp.]